MLSEFNYFTKVMGCDLTMTFITSSVQDADRCFTDSFNIAKKYEKIFSRFDKSSELSMLNSSKSLIVSKEFSRVLNEARVLYYATDGLFNPLAQVEKIGYDVSFEKMSTKNLQRFQNIDYDIEIEKISSQDDLVILRKKQQLDFGGFLKGYVAQLIADSLQDLQGVVINIGGDIYVRGRDQKNQKMIIKVKNPLQIDKEISASLENKALCTSGIYKRKWVFNNEEKHHIIDVRTKDSANNDIISVSVVHERGALADALATTAITLGSKKAEKILRMNNADFVIICRDGRIIATNIFSKKI